MSDGQAPREAYDVGIDSFAVAIRALWHLAKRQQWGLAEKLGIRREALEKAYDIAKLRFAKPYSDAQLFYFLSLSPSIFPAALELVRMYEEMYATERAAFHDGLRRLLSLPYSSGRRRSRYKAV